MNRKVYIHPDTNCYQVSMSAMVAQSLATGGNATDKLEQGDEGDVKEERRHYNVWDDNWSQEED